MIVRLPKEEDKIYKDECVFSFDTRDCPTGLYLCLNTFISFGEKFVQSHYEKTKNSVFLHMQRKKIQLPVSSPEQSKPKRMAIGLEGGFVTGASDIEYEETNSIVVLPEWKRFSLTDDDLPPDVKASALAALSANSATRVADLAAAAGTWDGEARVISKHAENLKQLPFDGKIPPNSWKCQQCDKTDNLWLNLTDGSILCGRKFWDGSGGNNHAIEHYKNVMYPLAVKLGTITGHGGDVFSYDEDEMVEDPFLATHLKHFGINMTALEKTEKTMAELEIDLNQKVGEWDVIQEAGSKLSPRRGPGFTGMYNLGNSCYLNAACQMLFTLPDFRKRYVDTYSDVVKEASCFSVSNFQVQMCKLGYGLMSGIYSPEKQKEDDPVKCAQGVKPEMFKLLIGEGHSEFSTKRQQDVMEFIIHLFSCIEKSSVGQSLPTECLRFQLEDRISCKSSGCVNYTVRPEMILQLPLPMETAMNRAEVDAYEVRKAEMEKKGLKMKPEEHVRPCIPLSACLNAFCAEETIDNFYSTALQTTGQAAKSTKLLTFPDYLLIQIRKFTFGDDWVPKKLDVSLDVPDELDLKFLRSPGGLQNGETPLPEKAGESVEEISIDETIVSQLVEMGFPFEACRRAVYNTAGLGIEAATNYLTEHIADEDFAAPFTPSQHGKADSGDFVADAMGIAMITSMGFSEQQAVCALKSTSNNTDRAVDWILNHPDEVESFAMDTSEQVSVKKSFRDGSEKYQLTGFISHMGSSTMCGHYVCHLRKGDEWVIFNDEVVAKSEKPPRNLAYLYLYKRIFD